jgi:hypothetical protein
LVVGLRHDSSPAFLIFEFVWRSAVTRFSSNEIGYL